VVEMNFKVVKQEQGKKIKMIKIKIKQSIQELKPSGFLN
jgi:hypothetical protein